MKSCTKKYALAATLILLTNASLNAQYYVLTDLGPISGPLGYSKFVNEKGVAVGQSMLSDGNFHATLWNGGTVDLGTLGVDTQSIAFSLNDSGTVVGVSYNYGDLQPHAFRWQSGSLSPLGDFSPHYVDAAGVIVGHRTIYNAANLWVDQACRWTGGSFEDLGTLGGNSSDAMSQNSSGVAVGQSFLANNQTVRACAWVGGAPHDLGTIAGTTSARSAAMGINDVNQVVGWSEVAGGQNHACLFQLDASGNVLQRTDLGYLANGSSTAFDVNNSGVVVGSSDYRGFVWQSGIMRELSTLIPPNQGWTITRATSINNSGVIAADGVLLGFTHAVLLTPVECIKADMNDDMQINGRDLQLFVDVLLFGGTAQQTCAGDLAAGFDGQVTVDDINGFVQCLLGGVCGSL